MLLGGMRAAVSAKEHSLELGYLSVGGDASMQQQNVQRPSPTALQPRLSVVPAVLTGNVGGITR